MAINECVIPTVSYSFGMVYWLESELEELDIKIRKMLNIYRVFEIKSDVGRLYIARSVGGRGLQSVWDVYQLGNYQASICKSAHILAISPCEVLQAYSAVDEKGIFSIKKEAEKLK